MMHNLQNEANKIRLSAAEKAHMKAAIFGLPRLGKAGAPSYAVKPSPYFIFNYQFRMALAGLLLFVVVGTGTASAAQGSLPGDLLYPVKLSVNEKVESALAPGAAAKAQVEVKLAERRVEEAETLASQGRLDATTSEALAQSVDTHAAAAAELAQAAEADEPGTTAEVTATLASSLSAHGAILAVLGRESKISSNEEHSNALSVRVLARAGTGDRIALAVAQKGNTTANSKKSAEPAAMLSISTFAATTPDTSVGAQDTSSSSVVAEAQPAPAQDETSAKADRAAQKGAAQLEERAANALAKAKKQFAGVEEALGATTSAEVAAQISIADSTMSQGSTQLQAADYAAAQASFTAVIQTSARLSALLNAQKKFDGGILRALIYGNSGNSSGD